MRRKLVEMGMGHWFLFMEAGLSGYLDGSIEEPSDSKILNVWKLLEL
jgi:hypothetical protein